MAKDPAFLFYPNDFLSGTQFMSDEQVGKYMRILMAQHQHGHLSEDQVIFICKSYDNHIFSKLKKDVKGLWYNERLEIEIEKRKNYVISRGKNKEGKTKPKITSNSYDFHMENRNENEDVNGLKNKELVPKTEIKDEQLEHWQRWGELIVQDRDQFWQGMKGRKVNQEEMDAFLSVATRNDWKMDTAQKFRTSLKGFDIKSKTNGTIGRNQGNPQSTQSFSGDYTGNGGPVLRRDVEL